VREREGKDMKRDRQNKKRDINIEQYNTPRVRGKAERDYRGVKRE